MVARVSPSQIKRFQLCQRKWGYRYLEGRKEPPSKGALLGSRVHELLESWLRGELNAFPDDLAGKLANRLAARLPSPSPQLQVEVPVGFIKDGLEFYGVVDLLEEKDGGVIVSDHKTTSSKRYIPSGADLAEDIQALVYAHAAFIARPDLDRIVLCWRYVVTRPPHSEEDVRKVFGRKETAEKFRLNVLPVAKQIAEARIKNEPDSLEKNFDACYAYGKCAYYHECRKSISFPLFEKGKTEMKGKKVLCVGCVPSKGMEMVHVADYVKPVLDAINEKASVQDYRMIEYGKGPGVFCAALREFVTAKPWSGALLVPPGSVYGQHAIDVLIEAADVVVQ